LTHNTLLLTWRLIRTEDDDGNGAVDVMHLVELDRTDFRLLVGCAVVCGCNNYTGAHAHRKVMQPNNNSTTTIVWSAKPNQKLNQKAERFWY